MFRFRLTAFSLLVFAGLFISACAQESVSETAALTPTQEGTLRPYPSNTPTTTPFPTGYHTSTPSPTVTPTPTPVFYDVQEGDDMYGIAFFYGISPQALMTANPTVNPRAMGPGTTLVIPITPGPEATSTSVVTNTPTPTPPIAGLEQPDCYPDAAGGLWCFVLVMNDAGGALENVRGLVTLRFGEDTRTETAIMPLNLLPEEASLPLVAYFQPPIPGDFTVSAEIDFYLPVMPEDARYLPVEMREQRITISDDGDTAQVSGKLSISQEDGDASYLWLHATALDEDGHVVAARRWEAEGSINAGETLEIEFSLYSLGGAIDQVNLLAEAHRQQSAAPTPTPTP